MIDTIVLVLTKDMYQIIQPDKFKPSANLIYRSNKPYGLQCKQNPNKNELRNGIYKPRLTLSNRPNSFGNNEIYLKIELSLPKLFFGNNFDELKLKDFKDVVNKLVNILKEMGILVNADVICKAPVFTIHYSKNIPLTDGTIPYHFINKLKESNIKLSLDVNQTDYRNDGHSYKWHCNAYEVVFYDKIKDLEKAKQSSKRAIEKDPAFAFGFRLRQGFGGQAFGPSKDPQLDIFKTLNSEKIKTKQKLEILRMEVRLNKRAKIKQLFKKLDIKSNLNFKSLFKPSISKKVLLHYLDEIESKRSDFIDYKNYSSDKALLSNLILQNKNLSPKQIFQMYGFKKALDAINIREIRVMLNHCNKRSWYRLIADANEVKLSNSKTSFSILRECLNKFKPVKIDKILKLLIGRYKIKR